MISTVVKYKLILSEPLGLNLKSKPNLGLYFVSQDEQDTTSFGL